MITNKNYGKVRKICIVTILLKSNIVKIGSADITSGDVFLEGGKRHPILQIELWSLQIHVEVIITSISEMWFYVERGSLWKYLIKMSLLRWALVQYNWYPYKKRKFGHTGTQEECHEIKAEIYDPRNIKVPANH